MEVPKVPETQMDSLWTYVGNKGKKGAICQKLGKHNSYVERTHLTSRHMNGRLVRKTLSYSKRVEMLEASSAKV